MKTMLQFQSFAIGRVEPKVRATALLGHPLTKPPKRPGPCALPPALTFYVLRFTFALLLGCLVTPARAVLPEPDNILFGTIALEGRVITAEDFDVVIEARRTPTGPAIASYQMGSQFRVGNFYSLRVPLESLAPRTDAKATFAGEVIYLVIRDINGPRETRTATVGTRGALLRLDIGSAGSDSDGDGLPDAWEIAHCGTLTNAPGTLGANGQTALYNYVAGTNPNDPNDTFMLTVTQNGSNKSLSFFARRAEGIGYEGCDRIYALECSTNVASGSWLGIANQTNIVGNNTTVTYQTVEPGREVFYRGQVRLRQP